MDLLRKVLRHVVRKVVVGGDISGAELVLSDAVAHSVTSLDNCLAG